MTLRNRRATATLALSVCRLGDRFCRGFGLGEPGGFSHGERAGGGQQRGVDRRQPRRPAPACDVQREVDGSERSVTGSVTESPATTRWTVSR